MLPRSVWELAFSVITDEPTGEVSAASPRPATMIINEAEDEVSVRGDRGAGW